jgi:putative endonuclease
MKHFVYLIISFGNKRLISYVGYTNNIKKRLKLHNSSKGAKFTRGRKWKIIYKKSYNTKSEAMKNEYLLKKIKKKDLKLSKNIKKNIKLLNESIYLTSL